MYTNARKTYQQQSVKTATPEKLILELYNLGVRACREDDRDKVRSVLVELLGSLDHDRGGEIADRLQAIYEYCLNESATGDLSDVQDILEGLRDAWKEGVIQQAG